MPIFTMAAIFDFDGVIADGFEANYLGWEQCFLERKLTGFDREFFRRVYGTGARNIARPIVELNNLTVSDDLLLELVRAKAQYVAQYIDRITLIPGVQRFLNILTDFRRAIATGNSSVLIKEINRHFGIESFFDLVIGSEDVPADQADPKGFLIAAARLDVPPTRCLVIEDAPAGVAAAKRCGMKCLALTTSKPRADLAEADLVIDSYDTVQLRDLTALFGFSN